MTTEYICGIIPYMSNTKGATCRGETAYSILEQLRWNLLEFALLDL